MKKNTYFFDENDDLILVPQDSKDERLVKFLEKWRATVRERVAQEILMEFDGDDRQVWLTDILARCAEIARGVNHDS